MDAAEGLFKYSVTYGLGIVLSILIALFLFWILRYVLRENSRREERLASIIDGQLKYVLDSITNLALKVSTHDAWEHEVEHRLTVAHEYQKDEHEEIQSAISKLRVEVVK